MISLDALTIWMSTRLLALLGLLVHPFSRLGVLALATSFVFAALAYRLSTRNPPEWRNFHRYVLRKRIYAHPSSWIDIKILLFTYLLAPLQVLTFGLSVSVAASAIAAGLLNVLGAASTLPSPRGLALIGLCAVLFLAQDFGTYVAHRLSHRVHLLWAFHRVHHSAEVLTPFTLVRKHPVYDAFSLCVDLVLVAPLQGLVIYLFGGNTNTAVIAGVNIAFAVFNLLAANLRHSHIWLSFGPWLGRVLVSPAAHQVHHSKAPRHWDRNYGEVLAVWDWMLGSLYLPREREDLEFGLSEGRQPHPTLWHSMVEPFVFARGVHTHEPDSSQEAPGQT